MSASHLVVVFVRNRKKLDKYLKVNQVKNKCVVDVAKMAADERVDLSCQQDVDYLKVLVLKAMRAAVEKGKVLYYVPRLLPDTDVSRLATVSVTVGGISSTGMLLFYRDFESTDMLSDILGMSASFDNAQILEDY